MADAVSKRAFAIKQNRSLQQTVRAQLSDLTSIDYDRDFFHSFSQVVFSRVGLPSWRASVRISCSLFPWSWSREPMNWQSSTLSMPIQGESTLQLVISF